MICENYLKLSTFKFGHFKMKYYSIRGSRKFKILGNLLNSATELYTLRLFTFKLEEKRFSQIIQYPCHPRSYNVGPD
jgi:hypothetical protein